ncbi:TLD-domain-containing protein [Glomus cerebriforme]|uniref:TLD-domain-containing protein n=1 Tax=Glomus cerebriforme TaxID=658196 RepID=A0A397SD26_9GLOM|nr:TLD-domain-containing protein [Glomus cerebriforme]
MVSEYRSTLKLSPRCPKHQFDTMANQFDSVIINQNQEYLLLFANWIDKKKEKKESKYIRTIPYEFDLLYRVSRDGGTIKAFHNKCDNRGPTIVIIKIKGSEQIIGGYNPFEWDSSDKYKYTTDSFIFSFTDRRNTETAKMGYNNGNNSIGCCLNYGPIFGGNFYCQNDGTLWTINGACSNYYSNIDGLPTGSIRVDDYEVFQVIKKI